MAHVSNLKLMNRKSIKEFMSNVIGAACAESERQFHVCRTTQPIFMYFLCMMVVTWCARPAGGGSALSVSFFSACMYGVVAIEPRVHK